jgi:hypothetical protein
MKPVCEICEKPMLFYFSGMGDCFITAVCEACGFSKWGFKETILDFYGIDESYAKQKEYKMQKKQNGWLRLRDCISFWRRRNWFCDNCDAFGFCAVERLA